MEVVDSGEVSVNYIQFIIFVDVDVKDLLFQEEIFGLVFVFVKVDDWWYVIDFVNDLDYGLIVVFYLCDFYKLIEVWWLMYVGNFYFNCKCIGVFSGLYFFGGYGMSGMNVKVGGFDYLFWFFQMKMVV